jgi:hypothetical protein
MRHIRRPSHEKQPHIRRLRHIHKQPPNPRMRRMLKPRLVLRRLPGLKPVQRTLPSRRKRPLQKNADNSSKSDRFRETARSTCCEPLVCIIDGGV